MVINETFNYTINYAINKVCLSQETLKAFNEACKNQGCNPTQNYIIGIIIGIIFILIIAGVYLWIKKK